MRTIALSLGLVLLGCSSAGGRRVAVTDTSRDRDTYTETTLANGLRVVLVARPWSLDVQARLVCRRAGDEDRRWPAGLAQTASFALSDLVDRRCESGAGFAVDHGAATVTFGGAQDGLACAVRTIATVAGSGALSEHELDSMRSRLEVRWRSGEYGSAVAAEARAWAYGSDHLLARPITPAPAALALIPVAATRAMLTARYDPAQCALFAVGTVSPDTLLPVLREAVAGWESSGLGPRPTLIAGAPPRQARTVVLNERRQGLAFVELVFPLHDTSAEARASARVLRTLLGAGPGSRFNVAIREELGAAYDVNTFYDEEREFAWMSISFGLQLDRVGDGLSALAREVTRIGREGPTEEEVAHARARLRAQLVGRWETDDDLVALLADTWSRGSDLSEARSLPDDVMAVTREDVARAARTVMDWTNTTVIVRGPRSRVTSQLTAPLLQPVVEP